MILDVTYMSGAGNLFSVIDLRKHKFDDTELSMLANILCKPNQFNGIATEGLLSMDIAKNSDADFSVNFHNPDGSCGMMCGNGGRCAIRYARKNGFTDKTDVSFSLADTKYSGKAGDTIDIYFPAPQFIQEDREIIVNDKVIRGSYIVVGTEHFVLKAEVSSIDEFKHFDIVGLGKAIRHHQSFAPLGVNVNFYSEWNGKILLRTFERGVEAETGACGTGSIATVIAYSLKNAIKECTEVIPSSGLPLKVSVHKVGDEINFITLSGHAEVIGSQEIALPDNFLELGFFQ